MPKSVFDKSKAWWYLSKLQKKLLAEQRLLKRFGGESGVGAGKSPYIWAQSGEDMQAARGASITPTHFIEKSEKAFWDEEASIMDAILNA